jgi:hypothetical protein
MRFRYQGAMKSEPYNNQPARHELFQKVALMLAAACLILSGVALFQGEFGSAALGVLVSACALITSFGNRGGGRKTSKKIA